MKRLTKIVNFLVNKNGKDVQLNQVIEELNELAVAINHLRRGKSNKENLVKEICDVYFMMEQLVMIFGVEEHEFNICYEMIARRVEEEQQGKKE
jgi:phosphoribosyl-ATP pyrophosphohydrolase